MAALYGREAMVRLLLKHKADVSAADKVSTSELHQSPRALSPHELSLSLQEPTLYCQWFMQLLNF
jgi:ankyrin repeat protein